MVHLFKSASECAVHAAVTGLKHLFLVQEHFLNPSKQIMRGRRLDWLAQQLITKVTEHYLQRQHAKAAFFKRNLQLEKMVTQTVQRAADIPDGHVTLPAGDSAAAEVQSSTDAAKRFTVSNPGTHTAACNCLSAKRGNLCKHVVKVQPTISLDNKVLLLVLLVVRVRLMPALMHAQVALLMEPSLEAGHFVRHVGTLSGTPSGGLSGMYTALRQAPQPAATARTAAGVQAAASQAAQGEAAADGEAAAQPGGDTNGNAADMAPAPAQRAPRQVSEKERTLRYARGLLSLAEQVAASDSRCPLLAARMGHALFDCQRMMAALAPVGSAAAAAHSLQVNPAAREGWSLKRHRSFLEQAKRRNRRPYVQRAPLAGGSPGKAPPVPLHRPPAVKRVPVMQQVSRQTEHQARKAAAASVAARAGALKAGRRKRCKPATAQQENMAPRSTSCGRAAATSCAAQPLGLHDMQHYVTAGAATHSCADEHGADHAEERRHKRARKAPAWQRGFVAGDEC